MPKKEEQIKKDNAKPKETDKPNDVTKSKDEDKTKEDNNNKKMIPQQPLTDIPQFTKIRYFINRTSDSDTSSNNLFYTITSTTTPVSISEKQLNRQLL